jgi:hypothetical protein
MTEQKEDRPDNELAEKVTSAQAILGTAKDADMPVLAPTIPLGDSSSLSMHAEAAGQIPVMPLVDLEQLSRPQRRELGRMATDVPDQKANLASLMQQHGNLPAYSDEWEASVARPVRSQLESTPAALSVKPAIETEVAAYSAQHSAEFIALKDLYARVKQYAPNLAVDAFLSTVLRGEQEGEYKLHPFTGSLKAVSPEDYEFMIPAGKELMQYVELKPSQQDKPEERQKLAQGGDVDKQEIVVMPGEKYIDAQTAQENLADLQLINNGNAMAASKSLDEIPGVEIPKDKGIPGQDSVSIPDADAGGFVVKTSMADTPHMAGGGEVPATDMPAVDMKDANSPRMAGGGDIKSAAFKVTPDSLEDRIVQAIASSGGFGFEYNQASRNYDPADLAETLDSTPAAVTEALRNLERTDNAATERAKSEAKFKAMTSVKESQATQAAANDRTIETNSRKESVLPKGDWKPIADQSGFIEQVSKLDRFVPLNVSVQPSTKTTVEQLNQIGQALATAKNAGARLPPNVIIGHGGKGIWSDAAKDAYSRRSGGGHASLHYKAGIGDAELYLPPDLVDPEEALRRYATGESSTPDPLHTLMHELGHNSHVGSGNRDDVVRADSDESYEILAENKGAIAREVGQHATHNPKEMVAEVFAGLMMGAEYSPVVMELYKSVGGKVPYVPSERKGTQEAIPSDQRWGKIVGPSVKMAQGGEVPATDMPAVDMKEESAPRMAEGGGIKSEAFKKWFGDYEKEPDKASKVVDEAGKPKVVYHGTATSGFDQFDADNSDYGLFGEGLYLTEEPEIASEYAEKGLKKRERQGKESSPGVYSLFSNIRNPIDMDAPADVEAWRKVIDSGIRIKEGDTNESVYRQVEEELREDGYVPKWEAAQMMQETIRGMGYDGITHIGGDRMGSGKHHRVWIAFEPTQIKSAIGNSGAYDPQDPRIHMAGGGEIKDKIAQYSAESGVDLRSLVKSVKHEPIAPIENPEIGKRTIRLATFRPNKDIVVNSDEIISPQEVDSILPHEFGHAIGRSIKGKNKEFSPEISARLKSLQGHIAPYGSEKSNKYRQSESEVFAELMAEAIGGYSQRFKDKSHPEVQEQVAWAKQEIFPSLPQYRRREEPATDMPVASLAPSIAAEEPDLAKLFSEELPHGDRVGVPHDAVRPGDVAGETAGPPAGQGAPSPSPPQALPAAQSLPQATAAIADPVPEMPVADPVAVSDPPKVVNYAQARQSLLDGNLGISRNDISSIFASFKQAGHEFDSTEKLEEATIFEYIRLASAKRSGKPAPPLEPRNLPAKPAAPQAAKTVVAPASPVPATPASAAPAAPAMELPAPTLPVEQPSAATAAAMPEETSFASPQVLDMLAKGMTPEDIADTVEPWPKEFKKHIPMPMSPNWGGEEAEVEHARRMKNEPPAEMPEEGESLLGKIGRIATAQIPGTPEIDHLFHPDAWAKSLGGKQQKRKQSGQKNKAVLDAIQSLTEEVKKLVGTVDKLAGKIEREGNTEMPVGDPNKIRSQEFGSREKKNEHVQGSDGRASVHGMLARAVTKIGR